MNQSQIHPALRHQPSNQPAPPFASPPRRETQPDQTPSYPPTGYSPLQPSPATSYQGIQTPQYYGAGNIQSPDDGGEDSPGGVHGPGGVSGNPNDPNDLKRPRACEACRQLKVKCELDDSVPNAPCKRCAKAGRQCIVTAPSRKRQKKTDSRVAELEKKIDALTASLVARGGAPPPGPLENVDPAIAHTATPAHRNSSMYTGGSSQYGSSQRSQQSPTQTTTSLKRKLPHEHDYFAGEMQRSGNSAPPIQADHARLPKPPLDDLTSPDAIERRLIDLKSAHRCFDRYVAEMCDQLPLVVFTPGTKMEDVRKHKPMLFLAILVVSSGTIRPDIQQVLADECTKLLADRIVHRGEKSLQLVQTVQVMTIFYMPPERYEELNFNQLIHIAAVMALDIGMGKRSRVGAFAMWREYMDKKQPLPDSSAAETRRCWLGCYYMCANSAMSLRRPLLIRWGPYADECLEILSTSPDALPSDKWLCHLVRAQHIAEDIGFQFSMDDPVSQLFLTDSKTQYHLKAFERQLNEWRQSTPKELRDKPIMRHTDAIINLYMHEIAMHHNHNIDDFKPPYNISPVDNPVDPDTVTPAHVESLTACLQSIHAAFDAILVMDLTTLRALPTMIFVRNSYAAVALIKMYSAVAARGSKFGSIFQAEDLKVESYLDRMVNTLSRTGEGGASRVASKFSFIFTMLKNWHLKRTEPSFLAGSGNGNGSGSSATTPGGVVPNSAAMAARGGGQNRFGPLGMKNVVGIFNKALNDMPDPNNTAAPMSWSPPTAPSLEPSQQPQNRSGLQMLSDAATRGQDGTSNADCSSNTPSTAPSALAQPQQPQTPQLAVAQNFQSQIQQANSGGWNMNSGMQGVDGSGQPTDMQLAGFGGGPVEIDSLGFTSDELMAMGNLMDDPGWFSFGLEQGGWAF